MAASKKKADEMDFGITKTGLQLAVHKFDKYGVISIKDITTFLEETQLPDIPVEQLQEEVVACGGTSLGFRNLDSFFVFLVQHLRDVTPEESVKAFQVFDEQDTGFIDMMFLSEIIRHLGDKMDPEEVDRLVTVSELDELGALNYDEALKISLNVMMETEINEMLDDGDDAVAAK